jgi:hypothetical protein
MKKLIFFTITLIIAFSYHAKSQELKLDDILTKYFSVTGIESMKDWQTITTIGKANMQGTDYPFQLIMKRPGKIRIEVEIQKMRMIQAYDGEHAWTVMPWTGSTEAQDMTADETKIIKEEADFEGTLYHWREKGHKAELIGREEIDGTPVYNIKIKNANGNNENFYIDAENYVILKGVSHVMNQGNEIESENLNSDFKKVNGVLMPFTIENKSKGQTVSHFIVDKYEINTEVNDSLFIKPIKK